MQKNPEDHDLVVLGSGEAGKYLAWTSARQGKSSVVIERKYVGGSCPNIACLPSKNVVHSAKVASYLSRAEEFGIHLDSWTIDMAAVRARKRKMVDGLVSLHLDLYKKNGAQLIEGFGQFVGPKTIQVSLDDGTSRIVRGKNVVISTGSRATIAPIPGLAESAPLTHIEALELDRLPGHLVILGGGYVGLEFAQALRRFGAKVTIVERNESVVHREDPDVTAALQELFKDEGIEVVTSTQVKSVSGISGESVRLELVSGDRKSTLEGTHILVAAGRTPNTQGIGLELAGIETTAKGFIKVNERLQTTAPGVWAVGDCAGSPHFTHIAFDDFRIVRDNLAGSNRTTSGRQVPYCLFTDPEFARIGLNEREAKELGIPYRLAKIPMLAVLRTRTLSETRGFMKALVSGTTDQILGYAAFGTGAGETLAPVQLAMAAGLPFTTLRDAIMTHPTLTEGLVSLFSAVPQKTV